MECIINPETWFIKYFPEINENEEFIMSKYVTNNEFDDKIILFHSMSWGLYELSKEEYSQIFTSRYFKQLRVILNKDVNEEEIAEKVYYKRSVTEKKNTYEYINSFVIFTTTACNARCPYCYEKGIAHYTMSEKTALDCVDFMIEKSKGKQINICWFGGEPLLNTKIIDLICTKLTERGVNFKSNMISNAFLFDEEMIKKAKELWKLTDVQITIDGDHDTYNTTKNYQNPQCDPFEKLMGNIRSCVDNDLFVKIRINIDDNNIDTLEPNTLSLIKYFGEDIENNKIVVEPALIYGSFVNGYNEEFANKLNALYERYPTILRDKRKNRVIKPIPLMHCMADKGRGVAINPLGYFEACEHWRDDLVLGHINSGVTNEEVIDYWQQKKGNCDLCKELNCPLLPSCEHMNTCPGTPGCLTESYQKQVLKEHNNMVKNTYDNYKNENGETE